MSRTVTCEACFGEGSWEVECCSGFGGCTCGGRPVPMGACHVCGGFGQCEEGTVNLAANTESIRGFGFIGSGPAGGYFGVPALGMPAAPSPHPSKTEPRHDGDREDA